jgi:hypothetical protein
MPMLIYGAWRDTISDDEHFHAKPLVPVTVGAGGVRHLVALGLQLQLANTARTRRLRFQNS